MVNSKMVLMATLLSSGNNVTERSDLYQAFFNKRQITWFYAFPGHEINPGCKTSF
jgi:hypothetical protein